MYHRKLFFLIIAAILLLSIITFSFGVNLNSPQTDGPNSVSVLKREIGYYTGSYEEHLAEALYSLGLFYGVGTQPNGYPDFDLDRSPTRGETLTMLLRYLDLEDEAKNGDWSHPFTDVPEWVDQYVGFAYERGLTNGISDDLFGADDTTEGIQYLTFVLRALGYSDENGDFTYNGSDAFAQRIGLTDQSYPEGKYFSRGDLVEISYSALQQNIKGQDLTMLHYLYNGGKGIAAILYEQFPQIPDLSQVVGKEAAQETEAGYYYLDISEESISKYHLLLNLCGFEYYDCIITDTGKLFYIFVNSDMSLSVGTGVVRYNQTDYFGVLPAYLDQNAVTAYYEAYPIVPDLGARAGVSARSSQAKDGGTAYYYALSDVGQYTYFDMAEPLIEEGFSLISSSPDSTYPSYVYQKGNVTVTIGRTDQEFFVMIKS